jgi:hypothetical protein
MNETCQDCGAPAVVIYQIYDLRMTNFKWTADGVSCEYKVVGYVAYCLQHDKGLRIVSPSPTTKPPLS